MSLKRHTFIFTEKWVPDIFETDIGFGYHVRIGDKFYLVTSPPDRFSRITGDSKEIGWKFEAIELSYLYLNSECVEEVEK